MFINENTNDDSDATIIIYYNDGTGFITKEYNNNGKKYVGQYMHKKRCCGREYIADKRDNVCPYCNPEVISTVSKLKNFITEGLTRGNVKPDSNSPAPINPPKGPGCKH